MKGQPLVAKDKEHQCQAVTAETRWKREKKRDLRCPFYARFQIGKKRLCLRHAHLEALALMLKDKKAIRLPIPPPLRSPYSPVQVVDG